MTTKLETCWFNRGKKYMKQKLLMSIDAKIKAYKLSLKNVIYDDTGYYVAIETLKIMRKEVEKVI